MNYIECINVDSKSTRKESFYGISRSRLVLCFLMLKAELILNHDWADLQLDVKGCKDVYASFDKYVEVENLEGDNKYHAEEHGLQVSCSVIR